MCSRCGRSPLRRFCRSDRSRGPEKFHRKILSSRPAKAAAKRKAFASDRKVGCSPLTRLAMNSKLAYQMPSMSALRPNVDQNLGSLLAEINRLARKEFDRRVRHLGLTRAQWLFLYHLARQPGATQSDLAELMQMEKISVSRQADRLEKAGWIERRDHRDDGRAYHLYLTPRAMRTAEKLEGLAADLRADYLEGVPAGRRARLLDDLGLIRTNLLKLEEIARR